MGEAAALRQQGLQKVWCWCLSPPGLHLCTRRYNKEIISRGKFAQLLAADNRSFTPEEQVCALGHSNASQCMLPPCEYAVCRRPAPKLIIQFCCCPALQALFERSAMFAYESFRNKAAESRGMSEEDMQVTTCGKRQQLGRTLPCCWPASAARHGGGSTAQTVPLRRI